jgi:hypothetical protein
MAVCVKPLGSGRWLQAGFGLGANIWHVPFETVEVFIDSGRIQ